MHKYVFLVFPFLLTLCYCQKIEEEEDNLQSIMDYHIVNKVFHGIEFGVLPHFVHGGFIQKDVSEYTNVRLDSVEVVGQGGSSNPAWYYFSINDTVDNPIGREAVGDILVHYYGEQADSLTVVANCVIDGIQTTANITYSNLSQDKILAKTYLNAFLEDGKKIFFTSDRTVWFSYKSYDIYRVIITTFRGNGLDRLNQSFKLISDFRIYQMHDCKSPLKANLIVRGQLLPEKKVYYPYHCNELSVIDAFGTSQTYDFHW